MGARASVIVVTYNSAAVVGDCLASLQRHLKGAEILVVDNGSEDDTVAIATAQPDVRVLGGHGNPGFGSAVNVGARAASHSLLLVMNPDVTLVAADEARIGELDAEPVVGLRACRHAGTSRASGGLLPAWSWRAELYWWIVGWFLLPRELPLPRPQPRPGRPRWVNGAAFVVRREEFNGLGGFDERFFLYFEDHDLSRSYRLHGFPVETTDAFVVSHAHARSSPRDEEQLIGYALLGLIEYAAKSDPGAGADAAAARCLGLLRAVVRIGRALGLLPLPILGPRAAAKSRSAGEVLRMLQAGIEGPSLAGKYPEARAALSRITRPAAGRQPASRR